MAEPPAAPEPVPVIPIQNETVTETAPAPAISEPATTEADIRHHDLWQRIAAGFQLQEHYGQAQVLAQLDNYGDNQVYFDLVAERARPFLFAIVEEIDRRGLPMELALLPMVESTFNPNAYSREHAVGLWQFLGSTADSFGLQRDWWYDGRRDPLAATNAALDYLTVLHDQFDGDWLLALAAYNTGDGNVRRAIRRSKDEQPAYWDLSLPRETRFHIPKLLALAAIVADSGHHPIELPVIANEAVITRTPLSVQIDLATAARLIDMDTAELRSLNPGYLQWATHPDGPHAITVPMDKAPLLLQAVAELPAHERVSWDSYRIEAGDTLGAIARNFNTRVDVLQTVNSLRGSRIIAGDVLLIPRIDDVSILAQLEIPARQQQQLRTAPDRYRVRRGDNLWTIARRYNLRSSDIASHNGIELDGILRPGQVLDLSFARAGLAD